MRSNAEDIHQWNITCKFLQLFASIVEELLGLLSQALCLLLGLPDSLGLGVGSLLHLIEVVCQLAL